MGGEVRHMGGEVRQNGGQLWQAGVEAFKSAGAARENRAETVELSGVDHNVGPATDTLGWSETLK